MPAQLQQHRRWPLAASVIAAQHQGTGRNGTNSQKLGGASNQRLLGQDKSRTQRWTRTPTYKMFPCASEKGREVGQTSLDKLNDKAT